MSSYNECLSIAIYGIAKYVNKVHDKDFIAILKMYVSKHLPVTPKKDKRIVKCPDAPFRERKISRFTII